MPRSARFKVIKLNKTTFFFITLSIIILCCVCVYLTFANISLSLSLKGLSSVKEKELSGKLKEGTEEVRKQLCEKYAESMAKFAEIAKNLSIEKEKTKKMESELKQPLNNKVQKMKK